MDYLFMIVLVVFGMVLGSCLSLGVANNTDGSAHDAAKAVRKLMINLCYVSMTIAIGEILLICLVSK